MILEARDLTKSFPSLNPSEPDVSVLKGVNIQIREGETWSLKGRSGSGKSTLISILAGLDRPSSGEVFLGGQAFSKLSPNQLFQLRSNSIGIIFQQFHLFPHLTAIENIRLPLDLRDRTHAKENAFSALESVGLRARAHHLPSQLSRGECQRVAIARMLVLKPQVLLADEPTASLDDETAEAIAELLFDLNRKLGVALLIATHDDVMARRCRNHLGLKSGSLQVAA